MVVLFANISCTPVNSNSVPTRGAPPPPPAPEFNNSDTARLLAAGKISTGNETSSAIARDGRTILFTRQINNGRDAMIMRSTWTEAGWSTPSRVNLGAGDREMDPQLSPDGKTLYFAAPRRRSANGQDQDGDLDIWMAALGEQPVAASTPASATAGVRELASERLTSLANSVDDESNPSADRDGTLFFAHTQRARQGSPDANVDSALKAPPYESSIMYFAERIRTTPVPLVLGREFTQPLTPFISYDGRVLIFSAINTESRTGRDLFVTVRREDGRWSQPRDLGREVNSRADEFAPTLSPGLDYLFFARAATTEATTGDHTGAGNIMVIPLSSVPVLRDALKQ